MLEIETFYVKSDLVNTAIDRLMYFEKPEVVQKQETLKIDYSCLSKQYFVIQAFIE